MVMRLSLLLFLCSQVRTKLSKCGIPDNIYFLPEYAQDEIKDLWKNWKRGTSCERELQIQRDIFSILDPSTKPPSRDSPNSSSDHLTDTIEDYLDDLGNNRPLKSVRSSFQYRANNDYDYHDDRMTIDDVTMLRFNDESAPFLRTAPKHVKDRFMRVWHDDDIPSDGLRAHKIQMLAVSLLNAQQLAEYNSWATKRRRVLRAREQELRSLSHAARSALRSMSVKQRDEPIKIAPSVKEELRNFAEQLNRRRTKKIR